MVNQYQWCSKSNCKFTDNIDPQTFFFFHVSHTHVRTRSSSRHPGSFPQNRKICLMDPFLSIPRDQERYEHPQIRSRWTGGVPVGIRIEMLMIPVVRLLVRGQDVVCVNSLIVSPVWPLKLDMNSQRSSDRLPNPASRINQSHDFASECLAFDCFPAEKLDEFQMLRFGIP